MPSRVLDQFLGSQACFPRIGATSPALYGSPTAPMPLALYTDTTGFLLSCLLLQCFLYD